MYSDGGGGGSRSGGEGDTGSRKLVVSTISFSSSSPFNYLLSTTVGHTFTGYLQP
jgi:hypothetical protein